MEEVIGALGEQFMADNSGVSVTYNPTGSGAGIEAVSNGSCDIGLASRALTDDEKAGGLTETIVALDGIAVIVNAENPVSDLTLEQIASIYTGAVTDWSEFGSDAGAIAVILAVVTMMLPSAYMVRGPGADAGCARLVVRLRCDQHLRR